MLLNEKFKGITAVRYIEKGLCNIKSMQQGRALVQLAAQEQLSHPPPLPPPYPCPTCARMMGQTSEFLIFKCFLVSIHPIYIFFVFQ